MPRRSTEQWLEVLAELKMSGEASADGLDEIRRALKSRSNHVVARAARLVPKLGIYDFEVELVAAFRRMLENPVTRDPNCAAKTAVARALCDLESNRCEVFLTGVRHVQLEPVFGGRVDTAAELRGVCGMGLAAAGHPKAALNLARLLADPEPVARQSAARSLALLGPLAALPLLAHKLESGDPEPAVLGECMASTLAIDAADGATLVGEFIGADDSVVAEEAALALGASRLPEAEALLLAALSVDQATAPSELLNRARTSGGGAPRETLIRALALLRSDSACEQLLTLVAEGCQADAEIAVRALSAFRHQDRITKKLSEIVRKGPHSSLGVLFGELFGG
jgi:HEAT repeat protein